jgi:hypothetical protein
MTGQPASASACSSSLNALLSHRAEFDGLVRHALSGLPNLRVLHLAAADGADDARHQPGFDVVMEDVAAREADAAAADRGHFRNAVEAGHVERRIARPALAADVLREPHVAVGRDVETGDRLLTQVDGQRVLVLLAETGLDHRL